MSDSNRNNHSASQSVDAWDDARITAYVLGELDGPETEAFEIQMQSDPKLQSAVQESREVTDQLSALFTSEAGSGLDEERREKILAASATESFDGSGAGTIPLASSELASSSRLRRWAPWGMGAAAAALLAAGVLVPPMMQDDRSMTQVNEAMQSESDENPYHERIIAVTAENEALMKKQVESRKKLSAITVPRSAVLESQKPAPVELAPLDQSAQNAPAKVSSHPFGDAGGMGGGGLGSPARASSLASDGFASPQQSSREAITEEERFSREDRLRVAKENLAEIRREVATPKSVSRAAIAAPVLPQPTAPASSPPKPNSGPKQSRDFFGRSMSDDTIAELDLQKSVVPLIVERPQKSKGQIASSKNPRPISLDDDVALDMETDLSIAMEGETEAKWSRASFQEGDVTLSFQESNEALSVANRQLLEQIASNRRNGRSRLHKEVQATVRSKIRQRDPEPLKLIEAQTDEPSAFFRSRDRYESITENEFKRVSEHPRSTFSVDVDTASYSKVRRSLLNGTLPDPNAVRIEELINYFDYDYEAPSADAKEPFATTVTIASCPWNPKHRLARVALQGKQIAIEDRPPCNLVFLLDTSGSMNRPNKLPLVVEGMKMLTKQLTEKDRVAIVVYAGSAGVVLDSTPASEGKKIRKALKRLSAGGSTNGSAGIRLAYATARDNFIDGGVNRVILCTDGDFNVGTSSTSELVNMVKEESSGGIFLTALGFGMDNHNDAMMEQISGKGNGNYAFIDTSNEAHKVLVRQTNSTLVTIAKDVKLRLEFNPRAVSSYRLIGYENRVMASKDFNDDKKDAGEIGAGHQVTALYEIVPTAVKTDSQADSEPADGSDREDAKDEDGLRYQEPAALSEAASSNEMLTLELRYKQPDADTSTRIEQIARDGELDFAETDADFRFASAIASFGMQLRGSQFAGKWTLNEVRKIVLDSKEDDEYGLRAEFVKLLEKATGLRGRN